MQPYQERVVEEQAELTNKIFLLSKYMDSPEFYHCLDPDLLKEQLVNMNRYSSTLHLRISGFESKSMTGGDGPVKPGGGG